MRAASVQVASDTPPEAVGGAGDRARWRMARRLAIANICEHMFVRWREQEIEQDGQGRLPGYSEAIVRHFDAPEALDTRFYEVHAKSALNAVPKASRMPFRWTINPYRGCAHACALLPRGRHADPPRPTAGRARSRRCARETRSTAPCAPGAYRRYVKTRVLDHWSIRQAGVPRHARGWDRAVTSGDHRFLSDRGWKYVTGAEQGRDARPHLTLNNQLMGIGAFAESAARDSPDYRRGYLVRLIMRRRSRRLILLRASRAEPRDVPPLPARAGGSRGARLAPQRYLTDLGIATMPLPVQGRRWRAPRCERSGHSRARVVEAISEIIALALAALRSTGGRASSPASSTPRGPSERRDPDLQHRSRDHRLMTQSSLADARLRHRRRAAEPTVEYVRIRGGLARTAAVLPLPFAGDHPQASIEGKAVKSRARLKVVVDRAARHRAARSTTSPPAPATSSPTASSVTTALPAPRTSTSTSTPAATSRRRSWSRSTCPRCCGRS